MKRSIFGFVPSMQNFNRYWLPVIAWCSVIFVQSAFATPDLVPRWPYFDKVLHAGVYALLGGLLGRAFNTLDGWQKRPLALILIATLLTALYGLSDEWHQSFVPERTADATDLLADFIGGLLGSAGFVGAHKHRNPRPEKGKGR